LKLRIQELLAKAKMAPGPGGKSKPEEHGPILQFFANLGPGLITGAADDDPSGISTYSVAGAAFGYASLWTVLFSLPLMASVQLMCARLAARGNSPHSKPD
jgi:Mn2+/Fe2+ NRAMP family transporter